jgi:hypothetical protein
MGAIVDVLLLGSEELETITNEYPGCHFMRLSYQDDIISQYRVIIPNEDEDSYYEFLVKNTLAMSSRNFYSRIKSDRKFAKRMETMAPSSSVRPGKH